jgi:CDP-glucose 4,6-dehydratase
VGKQQCALESVGMKHNFWSGKRVFLTGHTGFKGSWLVLWLNQLGAEVHGYALAPNTNPSLFLTADVADCLVSNTLADIRDLPLLSKTIDTIQPEIVFHLAAQPLVRYSYQDPVETYSTNVMGTVNLLEAVRQTSSVKAVVNVTTDKCYENREWVWPYREDEALGGHDPYSSSKACSEIITAAYRRSFMEQQGIALATARAGNVIGGGDWSEDRLIPDFLKSLDREETLVIRSPEAIRPWQHVLEPLSGYIRLAECLAEASAKYVGSWNFGPAEEDARSVAWIVEHLASLHNSEDWRVDNNKQVHEANYLKLDSSKARSQLGWKPKWNLKIALDKTLQWHLAWKNGDDMRAQCLMQIQAYQDHQKHH